MLSNCAHLFHPQPLSIPKPLIPPLSPNFQFKTQSFSLKSSPNPYFPHLRAKTPSGYSRPFRGCFCSSSSSCSSSPEEEDFDVELGRLLALLPEEMRQRLKEHPEHHQLIEVVMDLGRKPLARFPSGDFVLSENLITVQELEQATSQVGDFAIDNRAGISRTLHRISAIRNRKGAIIGLTCRVGRAITGSASLLRDLVQNGLSLLLIGPPGVGKTTIIREIARMLANDHKKRVMIVDTSNEIGGDGDIPHAGIGNARRMQVPISDMQHKVLIEAVENHMPQVIVIDEIGTKLEAMAASTIAQRGIQLVATAHGVTIENLIMNPSLEMLVGGVQSVTLGDEEASRRGVQKTVLERKGPATFSCGVEIISKTELRVHRSLETTVDAILSGRFANFEVRKINSQGSEETTEIENFHPTSLDEHDDNVIEVSKSLSEKGYGYSDLTPEVSPYMQVDSEDEGMDLRLFVYGILEATVIQGIKQLKMDEAAIKLTDDISKADALFGMQSKLKKNPGIQAAAKSHGTPIYVTKTSALVEIKKALRLLLNDYYGGLNDYGPVDKMQSSEKADALEEARIAIEQVVIPKGEPVDLLPRSPHIMPLQIDLIRKYKLEAEKIGHEADVRLRILPYHATVIEENHTSKRTANDDDDEFDEVSGTNGSTNGSLPTVERLPLLPD
ncbi:protein SEEDLING PLASTID DEVELOPMENT 1 [Argentina anserina]|uniref:protein SEEDLING PLASTID DEVELOPMENT 1 n=1 Tax=Argentina anserina TaxID=57926 RepID=UPI0021764637|nr:protein SEEDLING PLASTID DEVELOPMENT 1 [Potentilla anserina]